MFTALMKIPNNSTVKGKYLLEIVLCHSSNCSNGRYAEEKIGFSVK
jgi:hypothetical protein